MSRCLVVRRTAWELEGSIQLAGEETGDATQKDGRAQPLARRRQENPIPHLISLIWRRRHKKPFPSPHRKPANAGLIFLLWMRSALNQTIQDNRSMPSTSPFLFCAPGGSTPTRTKPKTTISPTKTAVKSLFVVSLSASFFLAVFRCCQNQACRQRHLLAVEGGLGRTFRLGVVGEEQGGWLGCVLGFLLERRNRMEAGLLCRPRTLFTFHSRIGSCFSLIGWL